MEIWRKTPLAPEFIEVSSKGRVRTLERITPYLHGGKELTQKRPSKIFSPFLGSNGYQYIQCQHDGKRRKYLVHRLVASAFCDGFDPSLSVNHIDGVKTNNNPENLEWITLAENTAHQWRIGLVNLRGEANPMAKLTNANVLEIKKMIENGDRKIEIANKFGVSDALIYKIESGKKRIHG